MLVIRSFKKIVILKGAWMNKFPGQLNGKEYSRDCGITGLLYDPAQFFLYFYFFVMFPKKRIVILFFGIQSFMLHYFFFKYSVGYGCIIIVVTISSLQIVDDPKYYQ